MNDYLNEKKMLNVLSYADGPKQVTGSYVIVRDQGKQYAFPFTDVTRVLGVSEGSGMNAEMEVTKRLMDIGSQKRPSYGASIIKPEFPERLGKRPTDFPID